MMSDSADIRVPAGTAAVIYGVLAQPDSSRYQCAELLTFDPATLRLLDVPLLARVISACLGSLPALNAEYVLDDAGVPVRRRVATDPSVYTVRSVELAPETDVVSWAEDRVQECIPLPGESLRGKDLVGNYFVHCGETLHWLFRVHHVVADGFAIHAMLRWIAQVYAQSAQVGEVTLLPPSCVDISTSPSTVPTEGDAEDRAFWQERRYVNPPRLRSTGAMHEGRAHGQARVSAEVRERVRGIAQISGASEADALCAVVGYYCARLHRCDEYVVGFPLINRAVGRAVELSPQANVVPLAVPASAVSLLELIRETSSTISLVKAHGTYRSEWIRREWGLVHPHDRLWGPDVNIRPFSTLFRFASPSGVALAHLHSIAVGPIDDVEIILQMQPDGEICVQLLSLSGYSHEELCAHAERIANFLERVVSEPDLPLNTRTIATAAEIRHLVAEVNATEKPLECYTLCALSDRQRAREKDDPHYGDMPALLFDGQALTRYEFTAQTDALASTLYGEYGVRAGDTVVVHLVRSPAFVLAIAALIRLGAVFVPVSPRIPMHRRRVMIDQVAPRMIIRGAEDLPNVDIPCLRLPEDTCTVVPISPHMQVLPAPTPEIMPEDPAYVLFTSGSTGVPKAVVNTQVGIANRLEWAAQRHSIGAGTRVMHKTPCSFDVSVWEYVFPVTHGACVVVAPEEWERDPYALARLLHEASVEVCHFVPSALAAFVAVVGRENSGNCAFPDLRCVVCSGEALESALAQKAQELLGAVVDNFYGPAEAAIDVTAHRCIPGEVRTPIGRPVPNTRTYVVDRCGAPQPIGYPGELLIAGVQVARGYLGNPSATSEHFRLDPYYDLADHPQGLHTERVRALYATGDIASWEHGADGVPTLFFHGREDDQVKLRGQRLDLGDVSNAVASAPGVVGAVCVVCERAGEKFLVAYVTGDVDPARVRSYVADRVPDYMVPVGVVVVKEFPLTRNGKVDRARLPEYSSAASQMQVAPRDDYEAAVCACYAEILETPVTPLSHFFDEGGTSLSAVRLTMALSDALGCEVSLADVFAHPSPRSLVDALRGESTVNPLGQLLVLREHISGVPVVCFHPAGGLAWSYAAVLPFLATERGVVGIQSPGLDGGAFAESLAAEARSAVELLRAWMVEHSVESVDLVGWSVGGVLAQEVACILGDGVRRLVLLDAYPPSVWRSFPDPSEREILEGVLTMVGVEPEPSEPLDLESVRARVIAENSVFAHLSEDVVERVIRLIAHNAALMKAHNARIWQGHAWLIQATRNPHAFDPATWNHYLPHLQVVPRACTHPELIHPEHLRVVGEILA